jgi:hypothetical protein
LKSSLEDVFVDLFRPPDVDSSVSARIAAAEIVRGPGEAAGKERP